MSTSNSSRLSSLPLPPRAAPVRRRKPVARSAAGRFLLIDEDTADKLAIETGRLPRVSDMPLDVPVLIVASGVPSFKVEHVGAALKARGARGYWLVRPASNRTSANGDRLTETLVGFPGLHIARLEQPHDL
ncbi:hypothetical protein [Hyphomicrobium sp. NDB2Meth4]|uniref:hypothetical protein n=1 Tax=Hyphomicrobium sp. NDB2Meth4 TaxID=1892846 RepID=UPI000930FAE1|nr:hypothetical protein [Hyphomicrobium sp. NDB2Meth4]